MSMVLLIGTSNVTGEKVGHSRKSKQSWWVGPTVACDVTREEDL